MNDVNQTLGQRNSTHGDFEHQAAMYSLLQMMVERGQSYSALTAEERHALDMILTKISRILSGDPHFADHWHDIAGYATLVERALTTKLRPTPGVDPKEELRRRANRLPDAERQRGGSEL